MERSFLFLGTGGSMGIPAVACTCPVCKSDSIFNKRSRPAGLLKIGKKQFLIDAGPDFRTQALHYGINHLDGVLITHTHFDHIAGFDDLHALYFLQDERPHCLLSKDSFDELKLRLHYLFDGSKCKWADFEVLEKDFGSVKFEGVKFDYLSYFQAEMKVTGFRHDNFAYVSDIRRYDQAAIDALKGVDVLILSALRHTASEVHFSIEEAIAFARTVGSKKTFFTHIAHDLDHDETNNSLPEDIRLAHDGLEISF